MRIEEKELDGIFCGKAPEWLNVLFENEEKEATMELKAHSERYRRLKQEMERVALEYPRLFHLMEDDIWDKKEPLTEEELKTLGELVRAKLELMECYQRLFYLKGFRLGARLAHYLTER